MSDGFAITREEAEVLLAVSGHSDADEAHPCNYDPDDACHVFTELKDARTWVDMVNRLAGLIYDGDKPS